MAMAAATPASLLAATRHLAPTQRFVLSSSFCLCVSVCVCSRNKLTVWYSVCVSACAFVSALCVCVCAWASATVCVCVCVCWANLHVARDKKVLPTFGRAAKINQFFVAHTKSKIKRHAAQRSRRSANWKGKWGEEEGEGEGRKLINLPSTANDTSWMLQRTSVGINREYKTIF